ncbi:hypothetical protein [Tateyamaria pelophila]|uniref:hypothetical protein n=1 Tax=Tateyamaria pelophila TaxID=328415 RepID=UPI001CC15412|nr:hypothetical protein [Tateyamaria pelophila]
MAGENIVRDAVDPVLNTVGTTVVSSLKNPILITELGFGLLVLVLVISVHGWFMGAVSKFFAVRFARFNQGTAQWRVSFLVSITIALLASVHLMETMIWAIPIWWFGLISDFREAFSFVMESYTTLGGAKVGLPSAWTLLGPMIAISGLFTFSWTGSVMVYVMTETGRRHSQVAKTDKTGDALDQTES